MGFGKTRQIGKPGRVELKMKNLPNYKEFLLEQVWTPDQNSHEFDVSSIPAGDLTYIQNRANEVNWEFSGQRQMALVGGEVGIYISDRGDIKQMWSRAEADSCSIVTIPKITVQTSWFPGGGSTLDLENNFSLNSFYGAACVVTDGIARLKISYFE